MIELLQTRAELVQLRDKAKTLRTHRFYEHRIAEVDAQIAELQPKQRAA